ncbi:MAG: NHLP bacteriocin export ABC transporter permease/ATPase subunit [Planctomycetes bacterium]|nr:NHLP bacteriocin export ABC transporter permease/ATPase subunit [Planctomycetota bacterium]
MSVRLDGGLVRLDAAAAPRLARVVGGSLQVFAARLEGGRPEGPRRFLFECGPGDPLGFLPTRRPAEHGLIAVGRADIEPLRTGDPAGDAAAWADAWTTKLASSLAGVTRPPGALFADPRAERLAPDSLLAGLAEGPPRWLRVGEGVLRLQGLVDVGPDDGAVPLRAPLWAQAQGEVVLAGDGEAPGDPLDGPTRLLELVLAALAALDATEAADRQERLGRRTALAAEASRRSARQLASVLAPDGVGAPPVGGSDVFRAAALCGRALGLTLRAAPGEGAGGAAVEAIAAASHVRARAVLLRDDWWRQDCGPLVAFDGPERRPVALLCPEAGRYDRVDPASGARERVTAANEGSLDRVAYMLYAPMSSAAGRPLQGLLRGGRGDVARLLVASLVATALGLALPRVLATIVDDALPAADRPRLLELSLVLVVAAFGAAVFRAAAGYGAVRLSTLVDHRLQTAVVDRLLRLPLSFHRRYASGDLVTRAMAIHEMRARVGNTLMAALVAALMSLVHLAILIGFGGRLALLAVATGAACALVVLAVGTRMRRLSRAWLEVSSASQGLVNQLVGGVTKLRVGGAVDRAVERFAVDLARQQDLRLRQNALRDVIAGLNAALPVGSSLLLYGLTAYLLREDAAAALLTGVAAEPAVTPGGFLAFQASFAALIAGVTLLGNAFTDLLDAGNLWERARPIVEGAPEGKGGQADPGRLRGRLAVERVSFRYREGGPAILDDVTIRAEPGEMIALVGGSGCGKSTLLRVLLGLERPGEGSVLFDDQDLSGLDVGAVRRQIGTVMQDGRITAGSILTNVSGGRSLGLNEVNEAVKAAGLDEDVKAMPMGLHTVISEGGVNLSGGQRQRLLLARAFAMRPALFVLDEATSALDNRTQAIVTASLARLNATRVVVAHRLSTIQGADRVYVLERGRVVQEGTFAALAAVDGPFRALVRRQLPADDPPAVAPPLPVG